MQGNRVGRGHSVACRPLYRRGRIRTGRRRPHRTYPNAVRFEYVLPDGTKADYALCDRNGRSLAVVEAKRASANPADAATQSKAYAKQLNVPFIFLSNGDEV